MEEKVEHDMEHGDTGLYGDLTGFPKIEGWPRPLNGSPPAWWFSVRKLWQT